MNPSMYSARVRKVWNMITSRIPQPAAARTARTLSNACLVCATTSGPASLPAASIPTCPATTTSSPPGAMTPWEYIPSGLPSSFGTNTLTAIKDSFYSRSDSPSPCPTHTPLPSSPPPPPRPPPLLLPPRGGGGGGRGEDKGEGSGSCEPDVFEVDRLAVDPPSRRRDPVGELATLDDGAHEVLHEGLVVLGGQPLVLPGVPLGLADDPAVGRHPDLGEAPDRAPEAAVGQRELDVDAVPLDALVPARDTPRAVRDVVVAQPLVQRGQRRLLPRDDAIAVEGGDDIGGLLQPMVVVLLGLLEAPLEPHGVEVRGVGRDLGAEQVQRHRVVKVEVPLQGPQVDPAKLVDVVGLVLAHELARPLDDAPDARFAHEHVVRLFREHEAAGARERVEPALGEGGQLVLAVAVREVREHVERKPVGRRLVERAEDPRLVAVARAALEQRFGFLPAVAPEVGVEQVHHRPEVPAFLHVDLEEVAQVVE